MKALDVEKMEQIEGGIDCETSTGLGLGILAGAMIITAATGGSAGYLLIGAIAVGNDLMKNCY